MSTLNINYIQLKEGTRYTVFIKEDLIDVLNFTSFNGIFSKKITTLNIQLIFKDVQFIDKNNVTGNLNNFKIPLDFIDHITVFTSQELPGVINKYINEYGGKLNKKRKRKTKQNRKNKKQTISRKKRIYR